MSKAKGLPGAETRHAIVRLIRVAVWKHSGFKVTLDGLSDEAVLQTAIYVMRHASCGKGKRGGA